MHPLPYHGPVCYFSCLRCQDQHLHWRPTQIPLHLYIQSGHQPPPDKRMTWNREGRGRRHSLLRHVAYTHFWKYIIPQINTALPPALCLCFGFSHCWHTKQSQLWSSVPLNKMTCLKFMAQLTSVPRTPDSYPHAVLPAWRDHYRRNLAVLHEMGRQPLSRKMCTSHHCLLSLGTSAVLSRRHIHLYT